MTCPVILPIIAEQFGLGNVTEHDHLMDDLGGDQLDVIELVMRLEENFNITISDDEADTLYTVQDVCDCVSSKIRVEI